MSKTRGGITKSKAGHYTATLYEFNGRTWVRVWSEGLLSSRERAAYVLTLAKARYGEGADASTANGWGCCEK